MAAVHNVSWRQIRTLTAASIKSRYRNTMAGVLWVVLSPLLMFGAQGYVFKTILNILHPHYPLFLLTGLMPWIFLNQSVGMSTGLFVNNARLFKSFPIHPAASLISIIADNLINFLLTFTIILVGVSIFGSGVNVAHFLMLPIPFLFMATAVIGLCWFLATLQVFYHDVRFVTDFVLSVMFFLTPVFYPRSFVPERFQWVITFNPIAILLEPIQLLSQDSLPATYGWSLLKAALVAAGFLGLSAGFWNWKKNAIYFRL